MATQRHFTVLGAGSVGIGCAVHLLRDGHRVTLVDRLEPGTGCSFGNAGIIQIAGVVPLATAGILKQVPKMLLDPEGPLIIRWRHLPWLLPYLARFVASARPARVEAISNALAAILPHAIPAYDDLVRAAGAEHLIRRTGELYVFQSDAALAATEPALALRRRHGIRITDVPMDELKRMEPDLGSHFRHARLFDDCISTISPYLLNKALAERFLKDGGEIVRAEVRDVATDGAGGRRLICDGADLPVDELVIATGAFSKRWAARLGSYVPLDTERGYHVMVEDPGVSFSRPVVLGDQKVGLTTMPDGLRIAGSAELAGVDAAPNYRRAERLLRLVRKVLPDIPDRGVRPWMGCRPSTPDSLPVICAAPKAAKTWFAFGHGHAGLTMGAVTGRLIADLAAGRTPPIDMSPYDVGRFARF